MTLGIPRPSRISGPPDFAAPPLRLRADKIGSPAARSRGGFAVPDRLNTASAMRPSSSDGDGERPTMEPLMDDFDDTLYTVFAGPICPTCATAFAPDQYDDIDDRARCSNCGTAYRIPDDYRPLHPEDAAEYNLMDTPQSVALDQFRADAQRLADTAIRETAGASYELYARRFTEACEPYIDDLDPALRHHAIEIANHHGFIADAEEARAGFGPGLCSFSGIDEDYCHCGRHP
ncbi:hypothetical protein [Sphingobium yanoikuyae]|nr:hypothetical protein [Sphingobium yanoikuyae]